MQEQNNVSALLGGDTETFSTAEDSLSISQILHVFWLHRKIFIFVSLLIIILGTVSLLQVIPRFTASSKLLLGISKSQIVDVEAVLSGNMSSSSAIKNEVEILTSRALAKKVIEKLNLLDSEVFNPSRKEKSWISGLNPIQWLPEELKEPLGFVPPKEISEDEKQELLLATVTNRYLAALSISPIRGSQVIVINVKSTQPSLAAEIANAHAELYIIDQLDAKFDATQKATSWLNERLGKLRIKVNDSEKAVEIYRLKHKLTRGVGEVGLLREQLSEINSQLIIAKAEKAEASARYNQVKRLLRRGSSINTASEVLASGLIQGLRGEESRLTRKVSEMSVEFGSKHPKMIRIKAEIKELRRKINSEIRKIAAGLQNELSVASSRESSLRNSLKGMAKKSGASGKDTVQLKALEREANANKILFETFLNRFKETTSTKGMEEADARVISRAEKPLVASFPKKKLMFVVIVMVALFMASALVFILELMNPGLRTPEEIENFLGFPTLGLMPATSKKINPIDYVLDKPHSNLAEAVNSVRVALSLSNLDGVVQTVMITSSVPSEGKSTLALCIARSAAISGQRVIIIDTDLRRPSIEKKLGQGKASQKGLIDLLMSKENNLSEFMFKDERSELFIMPRGIVKFISSTDILTSHRMEVLMGVLRENFDLIIFDSPPVMAVADARVLTTLVDKTIFVVHWDKTPKKVVKAGLQQMMSAKQNIAGIVLQQVNLKQYGNHGYGDSGYYYNSGKYGQYYTN